MLFYFIFHPPGPNKEDFNLLKGTADSAFLGKAAACGSLIHSFSNFTTLIDFQPAVPVFQPGYANKSTYWKGGLGPLDFISCPLSQESRWNQSSQRPRPEGRLNISRSVGPLPLEFLISVGCT